MKKSKLISLLTLLGVIVLINLLSFPVRAQTLPSNNAAKQPTITKKVKRTATPRPKTTATLRPQSTATKAATQSTSQPSTSTLPATQTLGVGTSALTNGVPATLSTVTTSLFSPTPTALGMGTIVAQQTGTANASIMTSTALAKLYSPTPTNFGAASSTPGDPELTATSAALTTTPTKDLAQFLTVSPTSTFIVISAPMLQEQKSRSASRIYLFKGAIVLFMVLLYFLYREWKKPSHRDEKQ